MRELPLVPSARPVVNAALATLALTAVHHAYGGILYATPWRLHGAVVAPLLGLGLGLLGRVYARADHPSVRGIIASVLVALVVTLPVLAIGVFEGVYNHLVKDALWAAGAPDALLARMFPPPRYELPNDLVFELSGVAQIIPAAYAAVATVRFVRELHGRASRCDRRACTARMPLRCLVSIDGAAVELPDETRVVHLQFRRFAGCPVCNLHLRSFVQRHAELDARGIREVVVFHSPEDELRAHARDLPFIVIADPEKRLYRELGVEAGARALLDPRAWGSIVRGVARSLIAVVRRRERIPSLVPHGGRLGLPADFLITPDGRIAACKHGAHVSDQWAVDDVLALAAAIPATARPPAALTARRAPPRRASAR